MKYSIGISITLQVLGLVLVSIATQHFDRVLHFPKLLSMNAQNIKYEYRSTRFEPQHLNASQAPFIEQAIVKDASMTKSPLLQQIDGDRNVYIFHAQL